MELYTRFDIHKLCIGGYMDIPKGSICHLEDNMIFYNNKLVCYAESETATNFCENTLEAIEKADLLDAILPLDPPVNNNYWNQFGEYSYRGWQWYEDILYQSNSFLKHLLEKIQNKEDI